MAAGETYTQQQNREGKEPYHGDPLERNWVPGANTRPTLLLELEAWARSIPDDHSRKVLYDAITHIRNLEWLVDYKDRRARIDEGTIARLWGMIDAKRAERTEGPLE